MKSVFFLVFFFSLFSAPASLLSFRFPLLAAYFLLSKWIFQLTVNQLIHQTNLDKAQCYRFSLLICFTGKAAKKRKGNILFTNSFWMMRVTAKIKGWMWCGFSQISQTFTSSDLANSCSNISERVFCYSFCTFDKNDIVWWTTWLCHHYTKFVIHQENDYQNPGIYFGS